MPDNFQISVIIPNYNRAELLVKAIQSALKQTLPVLEILVCDDGSTDNSKDLVAQLNHPKVKWINCGKNGRPAIPRNRGIKESKGNWLAFIDNDDEWLPNKLEEQVKRIQTHQLKAVCTNAYDVKLNDSNSPKPLLGYTNSEITFSDLIKENNVVCSSMLVSKDVLLTYSLFPEEPEFKAIEDYVLWLRLSTQLNIGYINQPLLKYLNENQTSIRTAHSDPYVIFELAFNNLDNWLRGKNFKLTALQQKSYKAAKQNVKRRGVPTEWSEFQRKLNSKLNQIFKS